MVGYAIIYKLKLNITIFYGGVVQVLAIERKNEIIAKLHEEKKVVVSELSQLFNVTEETIRRDLEKIEKEGLAKKTYGGAILNESLNVDLPYNVRMKTNVSGKKYIGELIGAMINDGDHLILDASSTALFVAQNIKNKKNITVITNSIEIILELADRKGWKVMLTGGEVKDTSLALVGYQAERMIQSYHVDLSIFSCKGFDAVKGLTDSNENDAQIKKALLQSAKKNILAIDHSKFDKVSFTNICDISEVDMLVTDVEPNERWKQVLNTAGLEVVY